MQDKLFSLPVVTQISPYLSQRQVGELPAIIVSHPKVRAALTLQGAHLIAWQPSGEQPVLWLSDKSQFAAGKAIRGGVPICWPLAAWAGPACKPAIASGTLVSCTSGAGAPFPHAASSGTRTSTGAKATTRPKEARIIAALLRLPETRPRSHP